jgi:hypothetical protein
MRTTRMENNADFTCKHCGYIVSTLKAASGVINRNHCPYCLYSRHVDLFKPGDRLCACKGLMTPVGLTVKQGRDKYSGKQPGELMLLHRCTQCARLSINRIAADDDPLILMAVFNHKLPDFHHLQRMCSEQGITLLKDNDRALLHSRLFGHPPGKNRIAC